MKAVRCGMWAPIVALVLVVGCGGDDGGSGGGDPDGGPGDTTAPSVVSVSPADGTTAVGETTTIEVVWDEALDPATVTADSFGLSPTAYDDIVYDDSTFTVTLTTSKPYSPGALYQLSISGVADPAGNVATDFTSSFTIASAAVGRIDEGGAATHDEPLVVFNDDGNGVAAWRGDGDEFERNVVVAFYTAATSSWSQETIVTPRHGPIQLASNGDTFMLIANGAHLISYDGSTWTLGAEEDTGFTGASGLLSNGSTYLMYVGNDVSYYNGTWTSIDNVAGATIKAAATDGTTYLIAWVKDNTDLKISAFLGGAFTLGVTIDSADDNVRDVAMVGSYAGGHFIVGWTGEADPNDELLLARISYDGSSLDSPAVANLGETVGPVVMASNSTGDFAAWASDGDTVTVARNTGTAFSFADVFTGSSVASSGDLAVGVDYDRAVVAIRSGTLDQTIHSVVWEDVSWSSAVQLSSATGRKADLRAAGHIDAVTAGNNELGVLWTTDEAPDRVVVSKSPTTASSGTAMDTATRQAADPFIASGPTGLAILWSEDDALWADIDGTSAELTTISHDTSVDQSALAVSDTGLRAAAWVQEVGWGVAVMARVSQGAIWSAVTAPSGIYASGSVNDVQVAASGDTAMVVWYRTNGLYAAYFDGSSWQTPTLIDDAPRVEWPHLFSTPEGYTLVWYRRSDDAIILQSFSAGSWGGEEPLLMPWDPGQVAVVQGPAGLALYAHQETYELLAAVYTDSWSALETLDADPDDEFPDPKIAGTADGFGFLWRRDDRNLGFALATGKSFASPETLTTVEHGDRYFHLVHDGTGFLAVWTDDQDDVYRAVNDGSSWGSPAEIPVVGDSEDIEVAATTGSYLIAYPKDLAELAASVMDGGTWTDTVLGADLDLLKAVATAEGFLVAYASESDQGGLYDLELVSYEGGWQSARTLTASPQAEYRDVSLVPAAASSVALSWESRLETFFELWGTTGLSY